MVDLTFGLPLSTQYHLIDLKLIILLLIIVHINVRWIPSISVLILDRYHGIRLIFAICSSVNFRLISGMLDGQLNIPMFYMLWKTLIVSSISIYFCTTEFWNIFWRLNWILRDDTHITSTEFVGISPLSFKELFTRPIIATRRNLSVNKRNNVTIYMYLKYKIDLKP